MTFSEKLQILRKNNGLSQEQLAERCNVSRQAVSKWESGQGYPEMEKVLQLCDVLKVDLDYLMRDKASESSNTARGQSNNIYKSFVGKWVKIFLNDKEFQGLYQVAITAVNDEYILFEKNLKKGVLKISDIKSMSDADISKRKLDEMQAVTTMEITDDYNPYQELIGLNCQIRLKCNSYFSYPQGYYDVKVISAAEDGIIIEQGKKTIAVKISDILMIVER